MSSWTAATVSPGPVVPLPAFGLGDAPHSTAGRRVGSRPALVWGVAMEEAKIEFLFGALPAGVDPDDPDQRAVLLGEELSPGRAALREAVANQIGKHRRVKTASLLDYLRHDDQRRRQAAVELSALTQDMGMT
jgi:hypothetical protein